MDADNGYKTRSILRSIALAVLAAAIPLLAGCGGGTGQPYVTPERLDKGLVVVLPGIHGRLWLSESIMKGLADGGVDEAIEIYDWTYEGHWLPFYNLGAVERNHQEAGCVARHIAEYQDKHPGAPVTLVGYSGGGPLAVWTAEQMPSGHKLDGVVLLSPPLVPEYDLTPALSASRRGIVNFYSHKDVMYLAAGTLVFGTMDKQNRVSAGNVGFYYPQAATMPAEANSPYAHVFQVPYRDEMAATGHTGSHLTIGEPAFICQYVAPLVRARQWDVALMDAVRDGKAGVPVPAPASHAVVNKLLP